LNAQALAGGAGDRPPACGRRDPAGDDLDFPELIGNVVVAVIAAGLLAYLVYVLIRPERF
jgi:K+-transporting ATPase KdpF subunit